MPLTQNQRSILDRFDQIATKTKRSGLKGYSLAGKDITAAINSLIVAGFVRRSPDQTRLTPTAVSQHLLRTAKSLP